MRQYIENVMGLVYVIDSSDKQRMDIAARELEYLLSQEELREVSLLILANKSDIKVMDVSEIADKLGVNHLKGRKWNIFETNALNGQGL